MVSSPRSLPSLCNFLMLCWEFSIIWNSKVLNSQNHKKDSQLPFDWTPVYKLIVFVVVSKWSKSFFHREIPILSAWLVSWLWVLLTPRHCDALWGFGRWRCALVHGTFAVLFLVRKFHEACFWNAFFWFEAKGGLGHMFVENSSTWTIYSIESFGKFVYDDDHAWCEIPTRVVSKHQESHRFLEGILSAKSLSTIHGWGCIAIRVYSFFLSNSSFREWIGSVERDPVVLHPRLVLDFIYLSTSMVVQGSSAYFW